MIKFVFHTNKRGYFEDKCNSWDFFFNSIFCPFLHFNLCIFSSPLFHRAVVSAWGLEPTPNTRNSIIKVEFLRLFQILAFFLVVLKKSTSNFYQGLILILISLICFQRWKVYFQFPKFKSFFSISKVERCVLKIPITKYFCHSADSTHIIEIT